MIDPALPSIQMDVELLSSENENLQHRIMAEPQVEASDDFRDTI